MFGPSLEKTYQKIKKVEIQGATAVAEATLLELKKYGCSLSAKNKEDWLKKVGKAADKLRSARPTEALADNAVKSVLWADHFQDIETLPQLKNQLEKEVTDFLSSIAQSKQDIACFGKTLVEGKKKVFTHCHSSTVVNILLEAKKAGYDFSVFNTETRPLFQGRVTAKRLLEAKIPVTMVTDSAGSFFVSSASGEEYHMDLFLIGADAIFSDGSAVNKIGSYGMALAAYHSGIPIYSAASVFKMHPSSEIEIERRPASELWANPPRGLEIINYAFDRIPAELLSGYITEYGIVKPMELKKLIQDKCPWLLS
jgi:ribose 1,5-bisphosphate isomerase